MRSTGIEPVPSCYRRFVTAAVTYLGKRVNDYSIWNEPNGNTFLIADDVDPTIVAADLYRELYGEGRAAVKAANPDANVMIGELSFLDFKPTRWAPGGNLIRNGVDASQFLNRVASLPLETDGVAWHPYKHSKWPTTPGSKRKLGIGKTDTIQKAIDGLFNKRAPCLSFLYRPKEGGACERPALLYTEFGYLARHKKRTDTHTEARRANMFKPALERALDLEVKWMSIYNVTEGEDAQPGARVPADFGVFAADGSVRGNRPKGKGPNPNFDNPQPRRAYCDGIRAFALANDYPLAETEAAPC